MSDYTPSSYFPSSYYSPSYFGGGAADPNAMLATIACVATVSASLSNGSNVVAARTGGGAGRQAKRIPYYFIDVDGKRIYGTAEEIEAYLAALREVKPKTKKPKRVRVKATAPVEAPDIGTPVMDAATAIARLEERKRIIDADLEAARVAREIANDDEEEVLALLLAA